MSPNTPTDDQAQPADDQAQPANGQAQPADTKGALDARPNKFPFMY